MQETWVSSLDQEDPLEKEMATHSSILIGKSHGQVSRGFVGEYQSDEQAGVARLRWRVSGR